jgi:hypothetical protein
MPSNKPPEPEFLKQWRDWIKAGPPRCCHTCENYKEDGRCAEFAHGKKAAQDAIIALQDARVVQ